MSSTPGKILQAITSVVSETITNPSGVLNAGIDSVKMFISPAPKIQTLRTEVVPGIGNDEMLEDLNAIFNTIDTLRTDESEKLIKKASEELAMRLDLGVHLFVFVGEKTSQKMFAQMNLESKSQEYHRFELDANAKPTQLSEEVRSKEGHSHFQFFILDFESRDSAFVEELLVFVRNNSATKCLNIYLGMSNVVDLPMLQDRSFPIRAIHDFRQHEMEIANKIERFLLLGNDKMDESVSLGPAIIERLRKEDILEARSLSMYVSRIKIGFRIAYTRFGAEYESKLANWFQKKEALVTRLPSFLNYVNDLKDIDERIIVGKFLQEGDQTEKEKSTLKSIFTKAVTLISTKRNNLRNGRDLNNDQIRIKLVEIKKNYLFSEVFFFDDCDALSAMSLPELRDISIYRLSESENDAHHLFFVLLKEKNKTLSEMEKCFDSFQRYTGDNIDDSKRRFRYAALMLLKAGLVH